MACKWENEKEKCDFKEKEVNHVMVKKEINEETT